MFQTNQFIQYVGKAVALIGLAFSTAFIGRRTADSVAEMIIQPLTIWTQILGIVIGLVVIILGLIIAGHTGA